MNFACVTSSSFCTRKKIKTKKKLSEETQLRRAYIRSHNFSISANSSGKCEILVTKRTVDD